MLRRVHTNQRKIHYITYIIIYHGQNLLPQNIHCHYKYFPITRKIAKRLKTDYIKRLKTDLSFYIIPSFNHYSSQ